MTPTEVRRWLYVLAFRSRRSMASLGQKLIDPRFYPEDIETHLGIVGDAIPEPVADEIELLRRGESSIVMLPDISISRPANWIVCATSTGDYLLRGLGSVQLFNVFESAESDTDWIRVDDARWLRFVDVLRPGAGAGPTNQDAALSTAAETLRFMPSLGRSVGPAYEDLAYLAGWTHKGNLLLLHAAAPRFVAVIDGPEVPGLQIKAGGAMLNDFRFIDPAPLCDIAKAARAMPDWVAPLARRRSYSIEE